MRPRLTASPRPRALAYPPPRRGVARSGASPPPHPRLTPCTGCATPLRSCAVRGSSPLLRLAPVGAHPAPAAQPRYRAPPPPCLCVLALRGLFGAAVCRRDVAGQGRAWYHLRGITLIPHPIFDGGGPHGK